MELREYQKQAVLSALGSLNTKHNGIVVMPTGSGKSLVIASIAKQAGGHTIILQPTKEILEQNLQKMIAFGEKDVDVYSASCGRKGIARITFATIGSIIRKKEMFSHFDRIIVDECHLVNSKGGMYEEFITGLKLPTLGLTATPYRMRSYSTGIGYTAESRILTRTRPRIFSRIIHITQVKELFEAQHLCPLTYESDDEYDAGKIKANSTSRDYDDRALKAYNERLDVPRKVADAIKNNPDKHCLAFTKFRSETQRVLECLEQDGISAAEVSAETPKKERESIIANFRNGTIKAVVNVGVLTIGFDFPALDCIILGRPTKSVALFYQMTGRGIRPAPGKEGCSLIDLCDNVGRFGSVETFELYDANDNGMWRLRSDVGMLTGVDVTTGEVLEKIKTKEVRDIMPFGKHKGRKITDVPLGYLEWGVEELDGWVQKAFKEELRTRKPPPVTS